MAKRSKRVDINDAAQLIHHLMQGVSRVQRLRRELQSWLADFDEGLTHLGLAKSEMLILGNKLQTATPPAPKSAYNEHERQILESTPKRQGGWGRKRKKPARAKAQKPTVRKH